MTLFSVLFILLCYSLTFLSVGLFIYRIHGYANTPVPLKIPTMPAPRTEGGVVLRMAGEVLLFTSLFRANKWTWIGGYIFHVCLAVVLFRHLRYFLTPVPGLVSLMALAGIVAGIGLVVSAVYLFVRRLAVDRTAYFSTLSDYFALALTGLIGLTGLFMKFVVRTDVTSAKAFVMGLVTFHPVPVPPDPTLVVHLLLVLLLMVYLPMSKLLHVGGIFFSPTRNQIDDSREKRHVNEVEA